MEGYLKYRFFMGSPEERMAYAWQNRPTDEDLRTRMPTRFTWRHGEETFSGWLDRIYEDLMERFHDPNYDFFGDSVQVSRPLLEVHYHIIGVQQIFGEELGTGFDRSRYADLLHMYTLRLRHDCYDLPIIDGGGRTAEHYDDLFRPVPQMLNPPDRDLRGFLWIHPAIPRDTEKHRYQWNRLFSGKKS